MKKFLILLCLIQVSINCFSQVNFEKGYYYDNNNIKTECFIKNLEWLNNPNEILYKISKDSEVQNKTIKSISEFGVSQIVYKRFNVEVDRSSRLLNKLDYDRNPNYKEEVLFLKQIVKGNLNLYSYVDGNFSTFFYDGKEKAITQLVYKKYYKSESIVAESNIYKQELLNNLICKSISTNNINTLRYSKKSLYNIFVKYNTCKGVIFDKEDEGKKIFGLNLKTGINFNSFKIPSRSADNPSSYEFNFGNITGFQIGLESEFVLPFNRNKWAVIIETSYNNFTSESTSLNYLPETVTLNYRTLEFPVGLRHSFFLDEKSKFFINASYVLIFDLDSEFTTSRPGFEFSKGTNMTFGLGYEYHKFILEVRYDTDRGELFSDSNNYSTEFTSLSILLGVKIL